MKQTGKIFLYGVFTLMTAIVFLYTLFPSNLARRLIDAQLAVFEPEFEFSTKTVSPTFPPGLRLEPLTVFYTGLPLLRADHFRVLPELLTFFSDRRNYTFEGPVGTGNLKGRAEIILDNNREQTKITMNLTGVPLEALDIVNQWPGYSPSGNMNAYVDFDSRKGAGGTANVNIDIAPAKIIIDPPLMGLEQIDFSQLRTEMSVTRRMLQIRRCEADGPQFQGKISGSIIFRQPMEESRITLSCTLKPQPAFMAEHKNDMLGGLLSSSSAQTRGLVLRISGTLSNPQYVIR
jgi:type II secretion system protein N